MSTSELHTSIEISASDTSLEHNMTTHKEHGTINTNRLQEDAYTCNCGKSYRMFKNYKSHYVKYKCQPQIIVKPIDLNIRPESASGLTNNPNDIQEDTIDLDVGYNPILKSKRQLIGKSLSTPANPDLSSTGQLNPVAVIEVLNENKFAECANCGLRLLKKNIRRHQSNNCKTSKEIQLKQQLEAARNILSEYNNILVNNGIIGSNNVINDNRQIINVAINCITQEAKDHLSEETKVEIVGRIFTAFDCLLDHIYKDDRNKNIYYLGNGKKEVKYISENGEVNVGDADNIIGNIAMSHLNYLDELIDTHRDAVPKPYQKTIDQLINFHSTEDCNPGYIKKTGQKIMSFRDYAKAQVKKYEQEYITKHSLQSSARPSIS
jgi:hypothetical protein